MWIWGGVICPQPGESIDDAAQEAISLAVIYGAGSKFDEVSQKYDICFSFKFNDVELRAFHDSTVEELIEEYHHLLHKGAKPL